MQASDNGFSQPIVAIVGRPNVGKSSLFNRIIGWRQAIISDVPGTTRDRLMAQVQWDDYDFILVDTGGLESNPEGSIQEKVQEQANMAVADADVIVFVTDVSEGITPADEATADRLRRTKKPVVLVVNKVDNDAREFAIPEFYQLGLSDPLPVSAYHSYGIIPLMEQITAYLTPKPPPDEEDEPGEYHDDFPGASTGPLRLSIVGRTNVGKSLLLNAILGEERSIVSPVAGTTRDALDTEFNYHGTEFILIDTAGIRRRGQVEPGIEKYSVMRAVGAVNRSDITVLVTDATELATAQDSHIAGLAWEMCRGMILVINKWDLASQESRYAKERAVIRIQEQLPFMPYIPICFTSALNRVGITGLMQTALELRQERMRFVPARELQYVLADALAEHTPPVVKRHRGQRLRINRIRQVGVNPPTFLFSVENPNLVHFSYKRYLENRLRESFGFNHTHLKLVFKRQ